MVSIPSTMLPSANEEPVYCMRNILEPLESSFLWGFISAVEAAILQECRASH